jgi:hypothetical protein
VWLTSEVRALDKGLYGLVVRVGTGSNVLEVIDLPTSNGSTQRPAGGQTRLR